MRPAYDPLRSLVYSAGDRAIRMVIVDGQTVVQDGKVLTMDYPAAAAALEEAQKRVIALVPQRDWAGRRAVDFSPPTFPSA